MVNDSRKWRIRVTLFTVFFRNEMIPRIKAKPGRGLLEVAGKAFFCIDTIQLKRAENAPRSEVLKGRYLILDSGRRGSATFSPDARDKFLPSRALIQSVSTLGNRNIFEFCNAHSRKFNHRSHLDELLRRVLVRPISSSSTLSRHNFTFQNRKET